MRKLIAGGVVVLILAFLEIVSHWSYLQPLADDIRKNSPFLASLMFNPIAPIVLGMAALSLCIVGLMSVRKSKHAEGLPTSSIPPIHIETNPQVNVPVSVTTNIQNQTQYAANRPQIIVSWEYTGVTVGTTEPTVNFYARKCPAFRNVGDTTAHTTRMFSDSSKPVWIVQPEPLELMLPDKSPRFPPLWVMHRHEGKEERFLSDACSENSIRLLKALMKERGMAEQELIFAVKYTGPNPKVPYAEKWRMSLAFPVPRFEPLGDFNGSF
jgi:hypothetical protein